MKLYEALFAAGTIGGSSHCCKYWTWCKQNLNMHRTWVQEVNCAVTITASTWCLKKRHESLELLHYSLVCKNYLEMFWLLICLITKDTFMLNVAKYILVFIKSRYTKSKMNTRN